MARIAFCQEMAVEYMGYMTMSAVLKQAGHTVEVFLDDEMNRPRLLQEIRAFQPTLIGFSVLTPSIPWAFQFARELKELTHAPTIFGNVHAIMCPEIIHDDTVDMVCIGEGEHVILELCAALDGGGDYTSIPGIWVKTQEGIIKNAKRDKCLDLEELPHPDRSIYYKYAIFRKTPNLRIMNGRGCPYSCSFCANKAMRDKIGPAGYVRKWSPQRAIEELEYAIANHPTKPKNIFFIDEVFWVTRPWLHEFLTLYKERVNLPFIASLQYGNLEEEDVKMMADSGALIVYLASETPDEELRRGLLNKNLTTERILTIAGWLKKYGISYGVSAFFGLPGETVEKHVAGLDFYERLNPLYLSTHFLQPYPGASISEDESVRKLMPDGKAFPVTVHHEPYLAVPDAARLSRLKRVYFLCAKFPLLRPLLIWLTQYPIPVLFDLLFLMHFTYYTFRVERITLYHFCVHLKGFGLKPLLKKLRARGDKRL